MRVPALVLLHVVVKALPGTPQFFELVRLEARVSIVTPTVLLVESAPFLFVSLGALDHYHSVISKLRLMVLSSGLGCGGRGFSSIRQLRLHFLDFGSQLQVFDALLKTLDAIISARMDDSL